MKSLQIFRRGAIILSAVLASLITSVVYAEQKQTFEQFDIHYMASNTAMLSPEIAKAYQIQRSKSKAVLSIHIRDNIKDKAIEGLVRGSVKNAIGQLQALNFSQVKEQDTTYYLATFNFANQDQMRFDVLVSPDGVSETFVVEFNQQFFVE